MVQDHIYNVKNKGGKKLKELNNPFMHWSLCSRQKIYLILALVSLSLSLYGVWKIRPVIVDINDFLGLTSHLTIIYWLGLILIVLDSILVYLDNDLDKKFFIFILIVTGLILFGPGILSYDIVKGTASYYPAGEVKNILLTNKIDISSDIPLISYRSWPAFHMISASILYMTNIDFVNLIKYMPLFWLLFFILITFSIGKRLNFSLCQSFLLSFLSISSFWVSQYYYSPQSFGFLLYLMIFLLGIISFTNNDMNTTKKFLFLLIFSTIVIDHLLTTITTISSLIFFFNYRIIKEKDIRLLLITFLIIFMAWHVYLSLQVLKIGIPDFIGRMMTTEFYSLAKTKLNPGSQTDLFSKIFQLAYIFIFSILIVISLFLDRLKIKKTYLRPIYFWLIGITFISIIAYGTETYERVYMFSIVPIICIIIISFMDHKLDKRLFVSLMVVFIILFIPAHYGNESIGTGTLTELKGSEFFSLEIKPHEPYFDSYFYEFNKYIFYFDPSLLSIKHESFYKTYDYSKMENTKYIIESRLTNNRYMFIYDFDPLQAWLDKNEKQVNMLYNNGFFDIYKKVRFEK